ncbi:protein-disulfide reductase DsbD family protein [Arenimonas fontis]|uniref:Cytochrome C biogenesis protein n=1 Tax=Arenimonas fontis TaxID=2608255 RepID=A0A5B2ZB00_9GAMM|nr:protein-disulfide reductase DsbD [Arenimonas fontis]KAA2284354.1 cytochrome C biogenesis protein [Arenimonas fontis]
MTPWLTAPLALLMLALAPAAGAVDESDLLPIDEAFALSAVASERGRIEFTWKIADGYYLYRHRMGVELVEGGFKLNPLELPEGIAHTDEFFGDVQTYRNQVTAVLTGAAADDARTLGFRVKYQGCADIGICYPPHSQVVSVTLPPAGTVLDAAPSGDRADQALAGLDALTGGRGGTVPGLDLEPAGGAGLPLPPEQAFGFEAVVAGPEMLMLRFAPAPGYYLYRDRNSFSLTGEGVALAAPQWPAARAYRDEHFGEVMVYFEPVDVPLPLQRLRAEATDVSLRVTFQGCQDNGICYPPMTREVRLALPPAAAAAGQDAPPSGTGADMPARAGTPLWLALLLALGGGLILNLMPCVLPVLSLKALSLAQGGGDRRQARRSATWYTLGVLLSFAAVGAVALALRQAGLALGWGFQLQQPGVVAALALVMVAIGLALSGVFSLGAGLAGMGQSLTQKSGPAGDFFTGVLAVVVASPCTAPFMGSALAFAFTASPALAIAVFLALGLGLALPFLLIGWVPALAAMLPRPGAWMETLKQVLAFPMYLTAVWLLWVLAKQRGADAIGLVLAGAVVMALGLWWWEKARWAGRRTRWLALALALVALWPVWAVQALPAPERVSAASADGAVPYSAEALARYRAEGRVVFVNMTADWCVSCKANERTVLGREGFREALAAADAVYMKGDWTDVDPAITAFLESHGAVGVPLYVVYPRRGEPRRLPTLLTPEIVREALAEAARR